MTDRIARHPSRCYSFLALLAFFCALLAGWIALRRPPGAVAAGLFGVFGMAGFVGIFGVFGIVAIVFAALALRPAPERVNPEGVNQERTNRERANPERANLEHAAPQRITPEHDLSPPAAVLPKYPLLLPEDEAEIESMFQRLKSVGRLDTRSQDARNDASLDPRASGES